MADSRSPKGASIPEWQKNYKHSDDKPASTEIPATSTSTDQTSLEQARQLIEDESIRDESREKKIAFLESKGVRAEDIEAVLSADSPSILVSPPELKTIHDTSQVPSAEEQNHGLNPSVPSAQVPLQPIVTTKRDVPPIITYPEFLLKPQKPPPLVTLDRLTNAAYILAAVSALTYGASKYLVEPMLQTLTDARHDLAEETNENLEKLNSKLESVVSHVPYIASSAVLQKQKEQEREDDLDSVDSDPTELFHRDIATQTSPHRSRSNSSSDSVPNNTHSDPTAQQTSRLKGLHADLSSLLSSTNTHFSQDRLKERVSEFQSVLDKMDTTFNPFTVDYTLSAVDDASKSKKSTSKDNEINKFKSEIRALKGAFLSSRNFPNTRAAAPFAFPAR
ncbi:hypothetical protein LTR84_008674 [Exophiala bonariae]|uniref:Peroxisomal membrane protein PEX14 n=1 Tax=Exophiala bonariae TaxID=1690606 RepID=A0AAV9MX75_9EURO|nr:hypothetical protein LTR84_008674 [Exophiala bonariae]